MTEHQCQCRSCRPERFPPRPDDPAAPYIAVRVGRQPVPAWAQQHGGRAAHLWWVEFDGRRVCGPPHTVQDWRVSEALAGEMGWLVRTAPAGPFHLCRCGASSTCLQAEYGRVVLVSNDGWREEGCGVERIA